MISAVILNYLNPDLTRKSVDTLLTAADESGIDVEVIVVDNSAPQTARELRKKLPNGVVIIENETNSGFSRANNQGIEKATGDFILIMNNDLFINSEALETGVQYLKSHKDSGIWAPRLTDQQGNDQRSCARFPTLTGLLTEYIFKLQYDNRIAESANKADQPVSVDTVIGACMLIPRKVIDEVKGFDEDYFFNVEDVDLCLKIKQKGYKITFDPRCSAVHLVSASQGGHWHEDKYLHKSRILYFQKNHHLVKSTIAAFIIRTGIWLRKIKHNLFAV